MISSIIAFWFHMIKSANHVGKSLMKRTQNWKKTKKKKKGNSGNLLERKRHKSRIKNKKAEKQRMTDWQKRITPRARSPSLQCIARPTNLVIYTFSSLRRYLYFIYPIILFIHLYNSTSKGTQPCLGLLENVLLEKAFFF